jgi:hypothetical protein
VREEVGRRACGLLPGARVHRFVETHHRGRATPFDDVLLSKFGDHAKVRVVVGDGIYVDFYEHD